MHYAMAIFFFQCISSRKKKSILCRTPEKNLKLLSEHMDRKHKKCKVKYCPVYRLGVSGGMFVLLLSKSHY